VGEIAIGCLKVLDCY